MTLPSSRLGVVLLYLSAACSPAWAGNGLNVTGSGAQSLGMSGADIAVPGSSTAVNSNPANLTEIPGQRLDLAIEPFVTYGYFHQDDLNAKHKSDQPYGALLNSSYSRQVRPGLAVGVGLFVVGGAGVIYEDLNTAFGTKDEYTAVFGVTKLTTGLAWQATPELSIGGGVNLSYASIREKLYPNTSNAAAGFYGLRLDGAKGYSVNGRIGALYKISDTVKLGISYASINKLKLDHGKLTVNYSDLDPALGRVEYDQATVKGFALPQELGVGLSWQATPRLLLATQLKWLNWSDALGDVTLSATRPNKAGAPANVQLTQTLGFRDQTVFALGAAFKLDDRTQLLGGVNLARNPVPNRNITPTINVTQEVEFNAGIRRFLSPHWELASAVQYQPAKSERVDNKQQPYTGGREGYGVLGIVFEAGYHW
ncbi:MAG: outer membrane protein transport protein [Nevskia sp.]